MDAFFYQLTAGIASGGVYAIVALALVMIYQSTGHVNFAQGEMAMFSTYIAWWLINAGISYPTAFIGTVLFAFALGVAVERIAVRPMAQSPVMATVVLFIALLMIFNSVAGWLFTYTIKAFPSPFPDSPPFGQTYISSHEFGTIGVTVVVLAVLFCFFRFSSVGLAMRAAAQNPVSSRLVGINVGWMLAAGWGVASAIGAVAGMMIAPKVYLDPNMMSGILMYAFAAAILGGIDSPPGAVVGGFIVGILENLVGTYIVGTELKLSVALVLIVGVLTVRPAGLFGRPHLVKV